ncbi:MAG: alpha/beta hydrolase family protein [Thermoplasmatota archaeon]
MSERGPNVGEAGVRIREIPTRFPARDGFSLGATLFEPAEAPRRVVVLCGATAVKRSFYVPFARFLAECGLAVVTFDYRGVGGSRPKSLRGFRAKMHEWATLDIAGALDFAEKRWPGAPFAIVGHSSGGWSLGMVPNIGRVDRIVMVGSQHGNARYWPATKRWRFAAIWYAMIPAVATLAGHLPGWTGVGEDLPKGVALEWAHWCRSRDFVFRDVPARRAAYAAIRAPILAWSFTDDSYAPPASVDALLVHFSGAKVETRRRSPTEIGAPVGHFGFFRPKFRDTLWRDTVAWIERDKGSSRRDA